MLTFAIVFVSLCFCVSRQDELAEQERILRRSVHDERIRKARTHKHLQLTTGLSLSVSISHSVGSSLSLVCILLACCAR